jgi:hypothetical protein
MWISSFPNSIFWRGCLFSIVCFGLLFWRSVGYRCVGLCLDLLFWSIGLSVCFCANTMLFLLLWLCSIVWVGYCDASSIGLFAQNCFGYSRSFVFPYVFHDCFFYFCAECCWNFDRDCDEHVYCFWQYGHFHNVDSTNPRAWKIFPSSVFFDFSLQQF